MKICETLELLPPFLALGILTKEFVAGISVRNILNFGEVQRDGIPP
jgi:hypothetical protein